ncbi:hypothetical protein [Spiroplasma endosymbiont of Panorpa germanica]|uniref:hypothetical protein n=1 Tax=Spiroplasma endosymbiont of Panorpa germanica TaxID=3066314 RepID=UPI0030CC9DD5
MKDRSYKDVTREYEFVNDLLSLQKTPRNILVELKRTLDQISQLISNFGKMHITSDIKNDLYFDKKNLNIEAMVLKFVSFKEFQKYEKLVEQNLKADDESKILTDFKTLVYKKITPELKRIKIEIISFSKSENSLVLAWEIRGIKIKMNLAFAIDSKQIYQITEKNKKFALDFSIHFRKEYKIMNKLLLNKLDYLIISLISNEDFKIKQANIPILKLAIISDLQIQLNKNEFMREWVSLVFKKFLRNEVYVDSLFKTQDFYFKSSKIFYQIFNSFKLRRLNYVFNMTYPSVGDFLENYTQFAKKFIEKYNKKDFNDSDSLYLLYEFNPYLTSKGLNKNVLIRNWQRLNEESNLKLLKKYIYPDNKEIGTFVLFSIFYKVEID